MANTVTLLDTSNNVVGTFTTIQAAVNAASNGYTVEVGPGTYQEQVTVNGLTNLTIEGTGADPSQTVILSPDAANLVSNIQNPGEFHTFTDALVGAENGASVTIKNLTVNGNNQGVVYATGANGGGDLVGIEGVDSSLNVSNVHVTGTEDVESGVLQGGQGNKGIVVNDTNSSAETLTVTGSTVDNFQKAGILMEGAGLTVNVNNNTVTGVGANPTNLSQNLIELELGATGSITHNQVTGVSDANFGSNGVLIFKSGSGVTVSNNTVTGLAGNVNSAGIYFLGVDAPTAEGNTITDQGFALADDGSARAFNTALVQDNNTYSGNALNYYFFAGPTSTNAWTVTGTGGPDDLEGGANNDIFTVMGGAPNGNVFVGNGGIDTVQGYGAGYHVAIQSNQWVVTNGTVTDTLTGIEKVVIGGRTYDLVDNLGQDVGGFQTLQSAVNAAQPGDIVVTAIGSTSVTVGVDNLTFEPLQVATGITLTLASTGVHTVTLADYAPGQGTPVTVDGNDLGDTFHGNDGGDTFVGGAGNDTIMPGTGVDTLSGGGGANVFTGTAADLNGDTITDFVPGDKITITDANPAHFSFHFSGTTLSFDPNTAASATFDTITLSNAPTEPIRENADPVSGVDLSFDVLTPHGTTIAPTANQVFTGTVATFSDSDTANVAGDFTATVDWGDGQTTTGTVSGSNGSFTVSGAHTYAAGGTDTVKVALMDGTATATATTTATVRSLSGQMALSAATEGTALPNNTAVATFSDTNTSDPASSFTATTNWGDGVTTTGTVVGSGGSLTVEGGHTYADEGNDTASVTLIHTADMSTATVSGAVSVADADVFTPHGTSIAARTRQIFSGAVATFTDSDTANVAGDFTATVDWGDGQTTTGTVSGSGGSFTVSGAHAYTATGNDTLKVTLTDDAPGTATATATTTATVNPGSAVAYDFNGDGKSDLLFQSTNGTPQIWLMNGTSIISETQLVAPPPQWKIVTSGDFNGDGLADILWLNTVTNQASIWEMNGTSIVSAVGLPAPPSTWHIAGVGDLFGSGDAAIIWQNSDGTPSVWQMNGTSIVSAVALPNPGPAWKIVATGDFNGDGKTDILWDNTVSGQPAIWEMNGDSIVSAVGLTPQPANMEIVGTGDFNGDGDADILWLNTATNAPTIWMMNGTSVTSMTTLVAPPPSWRLVGTSDVNGDGMADLLWQNSDGTTTAWEMNGTSIVSAVAVGNPGVPWILNNNDPPLPSTPNTTNGAGTMHLSMPDVANAASSTRAGGPASSVAGMLGAVSASNLSSSLAAAGAQLFNTTTVASSLHLGTG
jgi:hypothetical protein